MKIDEIVIASCLLMVGLQGCQRMTGSKDLPSAFVSPPPIITIGDHMKTIADVPLSEHWANQYKFCNILIT